VYRSEMEGLGSAALAAMAAGVPVVASNVGGLPEAVEHERTGLLVSDGDFATPIRRLLDHPDEATEMGRRGRERVEKNFTIDLMVEKTLAAYKEVLR
jgi:starch synthase